MRKGYTITLSVLAIMILVTITVGTSYSYYSISDVQEDPNTLTSTCFNITYNDNGGSSAINLTNTYPMADTKGIALAPYTFTIENTCEAGNQTVNYVVTLNTLTASDASKVLPISSLKYRLDVGSTEGTISTFNTPFDLNPSVKTGEYAENADIDTSYSLTSGTLAPGESKTFNLHLWIKEDACENEACETDIMGRTFNGKVLVYSYL